MIKITIPAAQDVCVMSWASVAVAAATTIAILMHLRQKDFIMTYFFKMGFAARIFTMVEVCKQATLFEE